MKKTAIILMIMVIQSAPLLHAAKKQKSPAKIRVSAPFKNNATIPVKYTCKGEDVSPRISWKFKSKKVKSYAIVCEDPDAPVGMWAHWVIYNIPVSVTSLPEGVSKERIIFKNGMQQGKNSWNTTGYGGPCPPFGTHRYYFRVYALDKMLKLVPEKAGRKKLLKAMKGHIIGYGYVMGKFKK